MKSEYVYVLKKISNDLKAKKNGFQYPKRGFVEAPDWKATGKRGNGLHGLLWGSGSFDIESYGDNFMVLKVNKKEGFVNLGDKVKFRRGEVVLVTKKSDEAITYIKKYAPKNVEMNYDYSTDRIVSQGYNSTVNQGDNSTANQGDGSTAKQGDGSTANQGDGSTANQGYFSTAKQGNSKTTNQGSGSNANQGNH